MSLRILLCHNYYPRGGGEDNWVDGVEHLLSQHGHVVMRLSADTREAERLPWIRQLSVGLQAIYSFRTIRRVSEVAQAFRPDLAHVSNVFPYLSPSIYHALAARRIPVVQTFHNFRPLCPNSLFFTHGQVCMRCKDGNIWNAVLHRCVRNRVLPSLAYALAVGLAWWTGAYPSKLGVVHILNDFTAQLWFDRTGRAAEVLGNYIDASAYTPRDRYDPYQLTYLGGLSPWKGLLTLLRAMILLPEYRLDIIGDGIQASELHAFASSHGLTNVTFTGYLEGETPGRVANSLALVVPSISHDQFPLVILEAFALGVPVIGSQMGGIPYMVRPSQTGELFPAGDHIALAAAVRKLNADSDLTRRLGENARRRVESEFNPERFYQGLMRLYDKARLGSV